MAVSLIYTNCYSQNYTNLFFKRYASPGELPSGSCSNIYKDNYGFLWIGTGYGISVFNGKEFSNISMYSDNKGFYLGDAPQNFLQLDKDRLLITCTNGLFIFYYKDKHIIQVNVNLQKSPEERIEIIGFDRTQQRIIIKTAGSVYLFDTNLKQTGLLKCVNESRDVYVRNEYTYPYCFYYSNNKHLVSLNIETGLTDSLLLMPGEKGLVVNGQKENLFLVVSSTKIIQINVSDLMIIKTADVPPEKYGYFFFPRTTKMDEQGAFWIGGETNLFVYNTDSNKITIVDASISNFSVKKLNKFSVYDIWIDKESLFAACYRGGLFENKKRLNKFSDYHLADTLNAATFSMVIDKGVILGANDLKGIYGFSLNKNARPAFYPVANSNSAILQIERIDKDHLWVLFDEYFKMGIIDTRSMSLTGQQLSINNITRPYFDSINNFRLLSRDFRPVIKNIAEGLSYITVGRALFSITGTIKQGFKFNLVDTIVSSGAVSCISSGNIFILGSTKGELFVLENNRLIKKADALNDIFLPVKGLDNDKYGNVYSMTSNGLYIYNNNFLLSKSLLKPVYGMMDNKIYSGKMDNQGVLWMTTFGGIMAYNSVTDELANYPSSGLTRNVGFITKAMAFDNDHIFFGGGEGITQVNTKEQVADPLKTKLYFDEIKNGNKVLHSGMVPGSIAEELPFNYDDNSFSFSFKSISYQQSEGIYYKYKLEGVDTLWHFVDKGKQLNFLSLSAGKYKLFIKEIYPNNQPGAQISYSFTIKKPFWKTITFGILSVLVSASLVTLIIVFIFRKKLEQQRIKAYRQIALKNERERISQDLHDDLGTGLTSIRLLTKTLLARQGQAPGNNMLDSIGKISAGLIDQMSEIIWLLNHMDDTLNGLMAHLRMFIAEYLQRTESDVKLEFINNCKIENNISSIQRRNILLVSKEIFNNAIKYSNGTLFSVNCSCNEERILLVFKDNGIGLPPVSNPNGNGLNNIRKRIAAINGSVKFENDNGAVITIEIPKEKTI
ncbi:histidine kinase [Ferruginibacter sp. SUN106]|uniref:sensor histidine kinase n=1 Tax=Ferruginibacter sp. SUN106 TaxID=2978348 RepID=UPI003D3604B9